ncbi:transglutaminase family protein [Vannielia litorea]|uniref:transglutaminase family protein n=1 Tax=Vannielia litorea TaxID=1217970 RepID=UPI001C96CB69|nr:transglutaminase family protein [Vannielia litorea]MBY6049366.1 transglutaminase family protein [Vannielia litorea]MBY6076780.1 transglutaminase family protein [Vannielia litorea]MBY6155016.1 transglutaminase family protein [Vannielia litorea]
MRLKIAHETRYSFSEPVRYGLQQMRKTPKSYRNQKVVSWETSVIGGKKELQYEDQHRNTVELISITPGETELLLRSEGEVELEETNGVIGPHESLTPLWLFDRQTPQTKPGPHVRELARSLHGREGLDQLHALMSAVAKAVKYTAGASASDWSAEKVMEAGKGVCSDQTHVFISAARLLGHPARYVSGYLMLDDRQSQEAMHGWAEAHVDALGWVGFDVSNDQSPDTRYVRVATGLDYAGAAPVTGTRTGGEEESLSVAIEVAQQMSQSQEQ